MDGAIQAILSKHSDLWPIQTSFCVSSLFSFSSFVSLIYCVIDVNTVGFGMYGGRGEYTCKIKVFDLGMDGGGYEKDGTLLSETDEVPYECPPKR